MFLILIVFHSLPSFRLPSQLAMLQADDEDDLMEERMKSPFGSSFRTYISSKMSKWPVAHEKMLSITNHEGRATQNHFTPTRVVAMTVVNNKCRQGCGEMETLTRCWQGCKKVRQIHER